MIEAHIRKTEARTDVNLVDLWFILMEPAGLFCSLTALAADLSSVLPQVEDDPASDQPEQGKRRSTMRGVLEDRSSDWE